jgi:hypothetical protein
MIKHLLTSLALIAALAVPVSAQQVTISDGNGRNGQARVGDADTDAGTFFALWALPCLASTSGCVAGGTSTNPFNVVFPSTPTVNAAQSGAWTARVQDGSGNAITSRAAGSSRPMEFIQLDAAGNVVTPTAGSGGTALADDADFTTGSTNFTPVGGLYQSTVTACTDTDTCAAGITSQRAWKVTLFNTSGAEITGGTDYTHDAALTPASTAGPAVTARASAAAPTDVSADNDAVLLWALRSGALAIQPTFGGSLQATGNGTASAATPRVTIASDNSAIPVNCTTGCTATTVNEDTPFSDGQAGQPVFSMREDSLTTTTSASGDVQPLKSTSNGSLWVSAMQIGSWNVGGTAAHDAAVSGNPTRIGGTSSAAAPTSVTADGEVVNAWYLRNGAAATVLTAAGALIGGDATNGLDVDVTRMPADATELPAAAALADATANPTVPGVGAYLMTYNGSTWDRMTTPVAACDDPSRVTSVAIDTASSGNVELVALTSSQIVYVCGYDVQAHGTVGVQFIYGTGTACATGETNLTGVYNLEAREGLVRSNGGAVQFKTAASNALCIELSAAIQVSGVLTYVKQ